MHRDQALQSIKGRYAEYLQPAKKRGTYICPLCGNGQGEDGDGIAIKPGTTHLKCFRCGFGGSLIDLYKAEHDCTDAQAINALYKHFGITIDSEPTYSAAPRQDPQRAPQAPIQEEEPKDYSEYYKQVRANIQGAQEYLSYRGLSMETASRYCLGYDAGWVSPTAKERAEREGRRLPPPSPRLIIPTSSHSYLARDTRRDLDEKSKKWIKMKEGTVELYNTGALYNEEERPVFIVEGEIDALSIIEVGAEAVGLGMARNYHKLLELLEKRPTRSTLILCLDDDTGKERNTGAEAQEKLREGLDKLNISYIIGSSILLGENDPNDALVKDRAGFAAAVAEAEHKTAARPDNVKDYLTRLMAGEIDKYKQGATRKTGYPNLDEKAGGVYPGLYVLGAISSLGKTTFVHQMADQMAAAGEEVLYFSLEQSRLEMVSKSLSRLTVQANPKTAVTSLAIRGGNLTPAVLDAADRYAEIVGERMSVVEGNFSCTVGYITDYVSRYMATTGTKPIVIIDYLQILQGEPRMSTKEVVDTNVTELKRLSRNKDIPVFLISSLNRANYMTPVDFESFKESGGIEYTADVIWGLQLDALNDPIFDREGQVKKKREIIREAKAENPRRVELICLKNRYGVSSYKVGYSYYPQYDFFLGRKEG